MKYLHLYFDAFRKYATFKGRASRSQYWWFFLINFIIYLVLGAIDGSLSSGAGTTTVSAGTLASLYALAVFIPSLAIAVRRLHDIGSSGAWVLINLIPFLGTIAMLVLLARRGDAGANVYGAVPGSSGSSSAPQVPPAV